MRETIHGLLGEVYDETTQRILDDVCEITHHAWQTCLNMSLLHFLQMCMHCGKAKPFRITKKDLDAVDPLNAPLRLKVGKTAHTPLYWLCAGLLPSHETMEDFHGKSIYIMLNDYARVDKKRKPPARRPQW